MPCPFLTRLSANYIRNYGSSLIMNYRQHCPVMSRLFSTMAESEESQPIPEPIQNQCPFLSRERDAIKKASPVIEEDVINLGAMEQKEETQIFP